MEADSVSLLDIDVFARDAGSPSVLAMMDTCHTVKGSGRLAAFLRSPLHAREGIIRMQECLTVLRNQGGRRAWPFPKGKIEDAEKYCRSNILLLEPSRPGLGIANRLFFNLRHRDLARTLERHIGSLLETLQLASSLPLGVYSQAPEPLRKVAEGIESFFALPLPDGTTVALALQRWKAAAPLSLDGIFRRHLKEDVKRLLDLLIELDVYHALSDFNQRFGLVNPIVLPPDRFRLQARNLRHLFLREGRGNDVLAEPGRTVFFLTGPNMAGKSTWLKSLGLAVHLGHLGLGVPADAMEFSPLGGMLTCISISDSLASGNSYYMSEVKRVKEAALLARRGDSCLLLFDEAFKGTNVLDASDATHALVRALARHPRALVFLSSHLHEVADKVAGIPNVIPVKMEAKGGSMEFTYRLEEGVSTQRLGMFLLEEEGVIDLLESLGRAPGSSPA